MSNNYICKSCGEEVLYPGAQNQDRQPLVKVEQADDSVVIRVWETTRVFDDQGRPRTVMADTCEKIVHHCTEGSMLPGIHYNQPANPSAR